jgi:hypothetical protein
MEHKSKYWEAEERVANWHPAPVFEPFRAEIIGIVASSGAAAALNRPMPKADNIGRVA